MVEISLHTPEQNLWQEVEKTGTFPSLITVPKFMTELRSPGTFPEIAQFLHQLANSHTATYRDEFAGKWAKPLIKSTYQRALGEKQKEFLLFPDRKNPRANTRIEALCLAYAYHDRTTALNFYRLAEACDRLAGINLKAGADPDSPGNLHPLFTFFEANQRQIEMWLNESNTRDARAREISLATQIELSPNHAEHLLKYCQHFYRDFTPKLPPILAMVEKSNPHLKRIGETPTTQLFELLFCELNFSKSDPESKQRLEAVLQLPSPLSKPEYEYFCRRLQTMQMLLMGTLQDITLPAATEPLLKKIVRKASRKPAPQPTLSPLQAELVDAVNEFGTKAVQRLLSCVCIENPARRHKTLKEAVVNPEGGYGSRGGHVSSVASSLESLFRWTRFPGLGIGGAVLTLYTNQIKALREPTPGKGDPALKNQLHELMTMSLCVVLAPLEKAWQPQQLETELPTTAYFDPHRMTEVAKKMGAVVVGGKTERKPAEPGKFSNVEEVLKFLETIPADKKAEFLKSKRETQEQPDGEKPAATETPVDTTLARFEELFIDQNLDPAVLQEKFKLPAPPNLEMTHALQTKLNAIILVMFACMQEPTTGFTNKDLANDLPVIDIFDSIPQIGTVNKYDGFLVTLAGIKTKDALLSYLQAIGQNPNQQSSLLDSIYANSPDGESARVILQKLITVLKEKPDLAQTIAKKLLVTHTNSKELLSQTHIATKQLMSQCVQAIDDPVLAEKLALDTLVGAA